MAATVIRDEKLDFWLKNNLNVLFKGKHGVGKTSMIVSCFERAGLILNETFLYFSTPTLDPWVDFVGVPKETQNGDGVKYLDLVRPKVFAYDQVEAIFLDEYNRSQTRIRNAVMELIQFHSINGKKFNRLRAVWAAINPDDGEEEGEYNVEKLDPAQADRFQIHVEVPYKPSLSWFSKKFTTSLAKAAIQWWMELPKEEQNKVSPRRLEYALHMYQLNGDMSDVLPTSTNVKKLKENLQREPTTEVLNRCFTKQDSAAAYTFLNDENNYASAISLIVKNNKYIEFFLPLVSKEKIVSLMSSNEGVLKLICQTEHKPKNEKFRDVINEITKANTNRTLAEKIRKELSCKAQNITDSQDLQEVVVNEIPSMDGTNI